jgi:peptidoglycan-associated lipoprotein
MQNAKCYVRLFRGEEFSKKPRIMKEVERVMRKLMMVLVVLAFACGTMLMTSSCAKKQVGTGEAAPAPSAPSAAAPAPGAAPSTAGVDMAQDARAFEAEGIYFDFDKSEIKAEAKAILEKKAAWLRANPSYKVKIEGNCDERGTVDYNLALGDRRAKAAQKYLNALGISMDRMSTISYGKEKPICTEKNEKCWSKNRRDDTKLSK